MIEAIIVGLVLIGLIFYLIYLNSKNTQIDSYKEGDYVIWLGSLFEVIAVAEDSLVIKHTTLHIKYIVNSKRSSIKKVSKNFADKYLTNSLDK